MPIDQTEVVRMSRAEFNEYARNHTGLECVQALADERFTVPFQSTLRVEFESVAKGRVELSFTPLLNETGVEGLETGAHENSVGTLHGGVLSSVLDMAGGYVARTELSENQSYFVTGIKVEYMRAVTHDTGRLRIVATTYDQVGPNIYTRAEVIDSDGNIMASANLTCRAQKLAPAQG